MIESATFTNTATGQVVTFHDAALPFERFTTEVDWRQEEITKAQNHGLYGTYPYMGKRVLRVEGDLLASSSSDYWTRRLALVGAFDPIPGQRTLGTLDIEFTGIGHLTSLVTLDGYPELPIEGLSPSAGKWMIAFRANDPCLYGPVTNESSAAIAANKVVTSAGNVSSRRFVATITGVCHSPTIYHTELNKTVTLNNVLLGATDQLVFDFYNRTITQITGSGTIFTTRYRSSGEWFWLQKGAANTLKLSTSGNPANEKQRVVVITNHAGSHFGITFTLTYSGQTTAAIHAVEFGPTTAEIKTALEGLSNIAVDEVSVTNLVSESVYFIEGGFPSYYTKHTFDVEFLGTLAATNVSQMTGSATNLTGTNKSVTVTTTQQGDSGAGSDTATIVYSHYPAYLI